MRIRLQLRGGIIDEGPACEPGEPGPCNCLFFSFMHQDAAKIPVPRVKAAMTMTAGAGHRNLPLS